MSVEPGNRYLRDKPALKRGPNGERLCRWCGGAVTGRRQSWCGQACVEDYLTRRSSAGARGALAKRDRGVCAICGVDTRALKEMAMEFDPPTRQERLVALGYDLCRAHLWDADHVVPVHRGGGGCGIDNLRTLCQPCHKDVTREQARVRAEARRAGAAGPVLPFETAGGV